LDCDQYRRHSPESALFDQAVGRAVALQNEGPLSWVIYCVCSLPRHFAQRANKLDGNGAVAGSAVSQEAKKELSGRRAAWAFIVQVYSDVPLPPVFCSEEREWKVVSIAVLLPLALTEVFALRLGLSLFQAIAQYVSLASQILVSGLPGRTGTTEIKLLFLALTGNQTFAIVINLVFSIAALICMSVVFVRKSRWEMAHFAAVALFSLWSVYHRTYDSIFCLLPAALMVDLLIHKRCITFSRFWLAGLGLLIVSIPGVLVDRLQMSPGDLSASPLLMLGLHIERLLVFWMFWSLLFVMWKARTGDFPENELEQENEESLWIDSALDKFNESLLRRWLPTSANGSLA
jgi:hypothetical protein